MAKKGLSSSSRKHPLHLCLTLELHYLHFSLIVLPFISVPVLLWPCSSTYDKSRFLNLLLFWILKWFSSYSWLIHNAGVHPKYTSSISSSKWHLNHRHGINEELELHVQMSEIQSIHNWWIIWQWTLKQRCHCDRLTRNYLDLCCLICDCFQSHNHSFQTESSKQIYVLPDLIFSPFHCGRKIASLKRKTQ